MKITNEHFEHWLTHGYAVVEGFLEGDQLASAQQQIAELMPDPEGRPYLQWPFEHGDALNEIAVHPEVIAFVERGIGSRDIVCVQSSVVPKFAGGGIDGDQAFHCDYLNNMPVFPRDDSGFRQITTITYLFDVTDDLGPTAVVSQQLTKGILPKRMVAREERPDLYEQEVRVTAPAGSLFLYGMRTFHRGTAMTNPTGVRPAMWHVYQAADVPWRGPRAWDHAASGPDMQRALTRMTPRQREFFGFPKVGHPYWNEETIAGVAARYPEMDMRPYSDLARA